MDARSGARRHVLLIAAASVVLVALLIAAALALPILPDAASREALVSDHAFLVLLVLAIPVFALVEVTLVYSALRFRGDGSVSDGPGITENPRLEIGWVAVTLVLVIGLAAFGWAGFDDMRAHGSHAPAAALRVRVTAVQFGWQFEYPDLGVTSAVLKVKKDQPVQLEITSKDVIHSFWVPAFRVKQDAVPGRTTTAVVTPTQLGRYDLLCAALCGIGHTPMHAFVDVVDNVAFDAWLTSQRAALGQ